MNPPFWSLGRFFVAGVKSLGCLGKCAREREFMPRMAGLCVPGHSCLLLSVREEKPPALMSFGMGCCSFRGSAQRKNVKREHGITGNIVLV